MSQQGEAAEQVVNMATNITIKGVECVTNIAGKGAISLATFLIATLKDQKKTQGKARMRAFHGKPTKVFVIKAKDISKFKLVLNDKRVIYTGNAITPDVSVMYDNGVDPVWTLAAGVDYDLKLTDNTNAGHATVTAVAKGNYTGEVSEEFDIVASLKDAKVTIEPQVYCGHCYPCRHGKYNLCEELKVMGFQTTGTASEYFAVDASKVTPIPEDMSYEEGAMIEPLAVAVHGVKQMGDVKGMNITVIGAGPIGNLVAQTAKGMGAAKVMITDVSDLRLEKAKECGIDVCVNTLHKDFGEAMVEAFGPDKADVIYDCAGNNITMGQAIKYARKGSVIVLVAVFAGMAEVDLAVANDHELDIKSTMMYRHDDYVDGIRLVNEGKVHLKPLISKTFAFKDYLKAYQYIDDNRETTMKVIINVQED